MILKNILNTRDKASLDRCTDTIVGSTKNTPEPDFFEEQKNIIQNAKTQKTSRNMPKLAIHPSNRGL